jgi:5-methylcytosine-specific restriction endonuclease McrA
MTQKCLVIKPDYTVDKIVPWFDAFCDVHSGRAHLMVDYAEAPILTQHDVFPRPAVIQYNARIVKQSRKPRYSRNALFVRDGGACQYCGVHLKKSAATVDHIVPRAQGGRTNWENVALSCQTCNHRKADRTPQQAGMPLLHPEKVKAPDFRFLSRSHIRAMLGHETPPEWDSWLIG